MARSSPRVVGVNRCQLHESTYEHSLQTNQSGVGRDGMDTALASDTEANYPLSPSLSAKDHEANRNRFSTSILTGGKLSPCERNRVRDRAAQPVPRMHRVIRLDWRRSQHPPDPRDFRHSR